MSKIDIEIEKTIVIHDEMYEVSSDPLFYEDLKKKLEIYQLRHNSNSAYLTRNFKNLLLIILILVNIYTIIQFFSSAKQSLKDDRMQNASQSYYIDQSNYNVLNFNNK